MTAVAGSSGFLAVGNSSASIRFDGRQQSFAAGWVSGTAKRCTARGFTLIELLVVLVIVGVMVAAIAYSVGGGASRELERVAERTQRLVQLACERAEIGGRDIGFAPLRDGLSFGYFEREGWRPLTATGDDELRARPWGEAVTLTASQDGESVALEETPPARPPFACLASGELTPFDWEFARGDVRERWRVSGAIDGAVTLTRVDDAR